DRINGEIEHGEYDSALTHLDQVLRRRSANDEWGWRFRLLKARVLVSRKESKEALELLAQEVPSNLASTDIDEQRKLFQGIAHRHAQRFAAATKAFAEAQALAGNLAPSIQGQLLVAQGDLEIDQKNYAQAEANYRKALVLARQEKIPFLELGVLTDLGRLAPSQEHFDEAIDINRSALELSYSLQARGHTATVLGNLAWSYSELGDFEAALDYFKQGAKASESSGLPVLAAYWLTGIANSQIALHDYAGAEDLAAKTLVQARKYKNAQTITECLNILANIALQTNRLDVPEKHTQDALAIERSGGDIFNLSETLILAGEIARQKHNLDQSEKFFREVLDDPKSDAPLRWQSQSGLASVRHDQGKTAEAEEF